MQSDDPAASALAAVRGRAEAFLAAITITTDELRGYLQEHRVASDSGSQRATAALGVFASGVVNADRFSRLVRSEEPATAPPAEAIESALRVLDELASRADNLVRVHVPAGGDLVAAVESSFADAGRAFGAARVAKLSRSGLYDAAQHARLLESFPYRLWSHAERELAPPLVIELRGEDLVPAGLAAYLDGKTCLVLVIDGPAPPAALARLIAPGVFVMQTADVESLARLAEASGPAIAGVVPSGAAQFVHATSAPDALGTVEVIETPSADPRRPVGVVSVFQQVQDLRLLALFAAQPGAPPVAESAPPPVEPEALPSEGSGGNGAAAPAPAAVDPVGVLANWLLERVDLSDLESVDG